MSCYELDRKWQVIAVLGAAGLMAQQLLKWEKFSFRMRDEELMICTRLLGKEFSHPVLQRNLRPKLAYMARDSSAQPQTLP